MLLIRFFKYLKGLRIIWPIVALGLLLLFNLIINPHFFQMQIKDGHLYGNLVDILKNAAPIMIISIGLTLVIATRGIDISVGSVVAISAGMAAILIGGESGVPKNPIWIAMIAALAVATLAGLWNGMLVSRVGMQPIIATLILFVAGRGIAMVLTHSEIIWITYNPFFFLGSGYLLGLPFSLYIVILLLLITIFFTRRTAIGLFIESVGINPVATRFSGISAKNIILLCYAFTGFCAGVAGLIVCSNTHCADGNNTGLLYELDAILSVVLGGTALTGGKFYLVGSMIGALIISSLTTTILSLNIAPEIALVVKALVVFIVSLLQSAKFRADIAGIFIKKEIAA